jgi:hypothetical protein
VFKHSEKSRCVFYTGLYLLLYGLNINSSVLKISYVIMKYLDIVKSRVVYFTLGCIYFNCTINSNSNRSTLEVGPDRSADLFSFPGSFDVRRVPSPCASVASSSCWIILDQLLPGKTSPEDHKQP